MYSSGTTGKSKGVVLTHKNLIATGYMAGNVWRIGSGDETLMCVIPMFHMSEIAMLQLG